MPNTESILRRLQGEGLVAYEEQDVVTAILTAAERTVERVPQHRPPFKDSNMRVAYHVGFNHGRAAAALALKRLREGL